MTNPLLIGALVEWDEPEDLLDPDLRSTANFWRGLVPSYTPKWIYLSHSDQTIYSADRSAFR